jgi:hypothetical protein
MSNRWLRRAGGCTCLPATRSCCSSVPPTTIPAGSADPDRYDIQRQSWAMSASAWTSTNASGARGPV